jgi:cyclophilin family peptidyl-prolyl cis-trans isomerase
MANNGVHRNNSQFFISLAPLPHLDGRNVSIGRVVDGFEVLDAIEKSFTVDLKPMNPITVTECGLVSDS